MKRSFSSRILFRFHRQQSSRHSEHGALACPRGVVVFKARCCEPRETARAIPKLPVTACRERQLRNPHQLFYAGAHPPSVVLCLPLPIKKSGKTDWKSGKTEWKSGKALHLQSIVAIAPLSLLPPTVGCTSHNYMTILHAKIHL